MKRTSAEEKDALDARAEMTRHLRAAEVALLRIQNQELRDLLYEERNVMLHRMRNGPRWNGRSFAVRALSLSLVASVMVMVICGCAAGTKTAEQELGPTTAHVVSVAKLMPPVVVQSGITWSNVMGTIYVWTNGVLWKSYVLDQRTVVPAQWTAPRNCWPASNTVSFYQQSVTASVLSFTVFSGMPAGPHVYELQRTQDLEHWQRVASQDSPQTNSNMSFLMVDEAPVAGAHTWYRIKVD